MKQSHDHDQDIKAPSGLCYGLKSPFCFTVPDIILELVNYVLLMLNLMWSWETPDESCTHRSESSGHDHVDHENIYKQSLKCPDKQEGHQSLRVYCHRCNGKVCNCKWERTLFSRICHSCMLFWDWIFRKTDLIKTWTGLKCYCTDLNKSM